MIKLILFDLDGVLIESKKIHFHILNDVLVDIDPKFVIHWEEHLSIYDGLSTNGKLKILSREKGLPIHMHKDIWLEKQNRTFQYLENNTKEDPQLKEMFMTLQQDGYKLGCCSNSIRKTVWTILSKLNIIQYFDIILSNQDVLNVKPHPEIYWKAISEMGCISEETLIAEDSPHGLLAAYRSHAHVLRISSVKDVYYQNIKNKIEQIKLKAMDSPKWVNHKLNVLIPMAGAGSRFEKAGYTFPKPLIDVKGKPMIQVVIENLNMDAHFIYVVQKSHREKYNLDTLLNMLTPNCKIIEVDGITEGACCTALLAKGYIDNDDPLFFANSDQFVEWDSNGFMYKMQETNVDGGIVTFEATHPKWSFAKLNKDGFVEMVAEKNPISNIATAGYYYWKHGNDFVQYAEQMIVKNIRVNNEFYVCPVFNEAIDDHKKIITYQAKKMWGLGTPEDLNYYLNHYNLF